ncbi:CynX/NimT family MFS transporter [Candidatus Leptofilum sp.]|uniref:MFS transporter n=1 Tax=Candidatus Leptofilum sp. TaxID=3241576 RepID=UPI003B5C3CFD
MSVKIDQINTTRTEAFPRYRYVIGALILAAHLALGVNFFSISPLFPLAIEDYGITRATASLLIAVPTLIKAMIGLPGSFIVARFGLKRVFTFSWFMIGALTLSSLAPNYTTMLGLRLLYGVGAGLMMPAVGPLVMQWFPAREIPIVNSLNLIVMSLGIAVSVAIAAPMANVISWEAVLGVFGLVALIGALLWTFLGQVQPDSEQSQSRFGLSDIWNVLRNRTIFLLVVGDALVFAFYGALTSWLPTYFHEVRGMSLVQAGNVTGLLPFVGMVSVLVGGYLTYKIKSKRLFFIIPGFLVGIGGFGSFLFANPTFIAASVIIFGVGTWIYQPILLTLPMQLSWMTPKKIAVVWGASLTIAGFGMFISPIVVGASQDLLGTYVPGFIIWAVLGWALVGTGLLLPESDVSQQEQ